MDLIQKLQEQYIQEFSNNVPLDEFLLNVIVTAILVALLRLFYIHFGNAISNRRRFANNFLPLALGTLLIIMIVKSSIALSLGLVGALSIVRYRAAIKDPEELTYLFIAIGLGLAGGANQPILAIVAFAVILGILYLSKLLGRQQVFRQLKRMDTLEQGMDLSFVCRAKELGDIARLKTAMQELSPATRLSVIDQPDLIV